MMKFVLAQAVFTQKVIEMLTFNNNILEYHLCSTKTAANKDIYFKSRYGSKTLVLII